MALTTVGSMVSSGQTIAQTLPVSRQPRSPVVTTLLPASTPGVVLINTTPAAWAELERFNPFPEAGLPLPDFPLGGGGFNIDEDIHSWLDGQLAIALLPAAPQDKSLGFNLLLVAPIKDISRFNAFLEKLKATWGKPQIERDYKGTTLLRWTASSPLEPAADPALPDTPESVPDNTPSITPKEPLPAEPPPLPAPSSQSPHPFPIALRTGWQQTLMAAQPDSTEPAPDLDEQVPPLTPSPSPSPFPDLLPHGVTIALLPDAVAVATQDQALERLIDARSSEEPTLAQDPLFQRTLNHPQFGRSLVVGYGNLAEFIRLLPALIGKLSGFPVPAPVLLLEESQIALLTRTYNTVDSHLWVQPEGIRGQTNFYYTTPQPERATLAPASANQILTRLPAITYLSANSRNFKRQWQTFIETVFASPTGQPFLNAIRGEFRKQSGFDLEQDVIEWIDGEYAFFMFPTTGGFFNAIHPRLNLGIGLMLQTSDRPAAEAFLKKLDQAVRAGARGELAIVPRRVAGVSVVSWEGKDKNRTVSVLSHGWISDDTLVLTTGADTMKALAPKPYLPLHLNPTFQTATASFPIPNEGYFYVNMGASLSLIYGLVQPYIPSTSPFVQEFQRVLGTVRSVSTSNSATAEAQRVDSLWVLGGRRREEGAVRKEE
ncbi:DUF3352 domain-containing protein [Leptothermofonsia sichuanensis E412]|uniref:DUF3352 domain-containing protein n=1 Tax=Leptothermofonsia sichuanensis TaxID=2917832 RepID=UPI001CA6181A|nr:DUF3352 domain-containing protein [Leptothermofonsia sichuanensis]QZZ19902.1 DUF3352 domain-containing protein [Leptothermofonsia sichuanensis E412]